jgi:hypothetical protein
MHRLLLISEQYQEKALDKISDYQRSVLVESSYNRFFIYKPDQLCYRIQRREDNFFAESSYFVGADWIIPGIASVYVEPKLNSTSEVDFLAMLMQSLETTENIEQLDKLFHVEFDQPWITIPQQKDLLSPILIVQFLKLLQRIVRKGLKKSYYRTTASLNGRIKGKVLVSQQIKQNILNNRLSQTICNFQEYGINSAENQFLKLVLGFVSSYLNNKNNFFSLSQTNELKHILNYCAPAFDEVSILADPHEWVKVDTNPFLKEYPSAINLGKYILKRFSFNISKTGQCQNETPPFWIDMSKLFELYVFQKLKQIFPVPGSVSYHDTFRRKETDILITEKGFQCVIDCKYKPRYHFQAPSLEDVRQLAGYTRMKGVYSRLSTPSRENIKGVIVYANQKSEANIEKGKMFSTEITGYVSLYKIGIRLPVLDRS